MNDRILKLIKGALICISFVLLGSSIIADPNQNLPTLVYITRVGILPQYVGILLIGSGVANLAIGVYGYRWNGIFIAIWLMYAVASVCAYLDGANVLPFNVVVYNSLAVLLTIDAVHDLGLIIWEKQPRLSLRSRVWQQ